MIIVQIPWDTPVLKGIAINKMLEFRFPPPNQKFPEREEFVITIGETTDVKGVSPATAESVIYAIRALLDS